jgi:hypothetical protein
MGAASCSTDALLSSHLYTSRKHYHYNIYLRPCYSECFGDALNHLFHAHIRPGWPWQKYIQQEDSLHEQIRLRAKEETNEVLHLEHSFVW